MGTISGLFLLLAMACSASMAIALRFFNSSQSSRYGMILGNYLTCSLVGFFLLENKALVYSADKSTYVLGITGGILFVVSLLCMQSSINKSGAILTSAFSKLGLLVPLALSILFFHEKPGILQGIGLLLVIAAVWTFSDHKKENINTEQFHLVFLLIVLLTNGMADSMAKVYNVFGLRSEDSVYFFFVFFSAALLTSGLLLYDLKKTGKKISLKDLSAGILVGMPNYFSSVFLLKSLNGIPAFIVYPVFSSGTIVIVTAVSMSVFHECLNRKQMAGLLMILVSLVLLNV